MPITKRISNPSSRPTIRSFSSTPSTNATLNQVRKVCASLFPCLAIALDYILHTITDARLHRDAEFLKKPAKPSPQLSPQLMLPNSKASASKLASRAQRNPIRQNGKLRG